ncbi:hypothetical protein Pmani_023767 [Petrolisthes manimaculis]|uniref:dolichyl-diphosphooligosaccharide--protein glycotransferase n=1 Tax=Petrolisthes manimaculis TaxID=1843537 RepID=A0AAE1TZC0_9EUCA|nr:hypothetical protein Pmani_023767 [Petrolisthes manimaculis]
MLFNYRATAHMVHNGYYPFLNWFDERVWYPLGRTVGSSVYPGLMLTSGSIHYILNVLNVPVHIREICVFLAPIFSGLTVIATYLLTKEVWSTGAGLLAACFIAMVPGYTSRSVAGSYDNEGIAIFALMFTYYLWVKSVKTGSIFWASVTSLSYLYMITFVGFQPITTSEHMAAAGVFALLNAWAVLRYLQSVMTKADLTHFFLGVLCVGAGGVLLVVMGLTWIGVVAPWSGRIYSLWNKGYAVPIIASVAEHQLITWFKFFFDLHILVATFPVGLWYCIKNINDERVFIVLFAVSGVYFASVMVRLMLILTPVVCILAGIAFSTLLDANLKKEESLQPQAGDCNDDDDDDEINSSDNTAKLRHVKHKQQYNNNNNNDNDDGVGVFLRCVIIIVTLSMLILFFLHCNWVTSNSYSSPSIVLDAYEPDGTREIIDDFREGYSWLSLNTPVDAKIMSWWDYGYQITGMANRTTLVDNNTSNNSHIALVGKAMASNETRAHSIMTQLDVDYVLVIFGGLLGYSGDDLNKFLWMVSIAEGEHPDEIRRSDYFADNG